MYGGDFRRELIRACVQATVAIVLVGAAVLGVVCVGVHLIRRWF